jgi:hypothetical protein
VWKTVSVLMLALSPLSAPSPSSAVAPSVVVRPGDTAVVPSVVVRPGDTLAGIASRHGLTVADLRFWNGLSSPSSAPSSPSSAPRPDGLLRLTAAAAEMPYFRTRSEPVTEKQANGWLGRKCPVPVSDLRRIWVRYIDFQGQTHDGSLIMHSSLVGPTQKAFAQLYRWRFPIMVMQPASVNMPGLTDRSVLTSGYECRFVAGTTKWSQHSYGRAIDVNPRQNPMIRGDYLDPPNTEKWLARENYWPGMIHAGGAVEAFTSQGFAWGGRWNSLKDWMHFSTTDL